MVSSPHTASRMLIENLAQVNAALQNAAKAKQVIRIGPWRRANDMGQPNWWKRSAFEESVWVIP
jgi:hypothetical protein